MARHKTGEVKIKEADVSMEAMLRETMSMDTLLREAAASVERELSIEDAGWINLSSSSQDVITAQKRLENLIWSRVYYTLDPLGKQSIRLWTDYTFGTGMVWDAEDEGAKKALEAFWGSRKNRKVLSPIGQQLGSNKLLVDGEVFYAIFLGKEPTIRFIDPLEITEIVTNPEDKLEPRFYIRQYQDAANVVHDVVYRAVGNEKNESTISSSSGMVTSNDDALVYHLTFNTLSTRGNPLLTPALDWIKQYRRFLGSRVAIMLALARFAWSSKVKGGAAQVAQIKNVLDDKIPDAGSVLVENEGVTTTPIKTDSGGRNAYEDGRQIKLQVCAAVGIPEQYFGDISIGNLATAKTVELPMMKMFQSYQALWRSAYEDINEVIFDYNNIGPDKRYVDMDFPPIAPDDVLAAATALVQTVQVFPEFAYSPDVQQQALINMGINDPAAVIEGLEKQEKTNESVRLVRALHQFREALKRKEQ